MPSSNFPLVPVTWKNPRWPPRNPKIIDITKSRKLLDESCWFLDMFFFIQYNDRMQTAVSLQSLFLCIFNATGSKYDFANSLCVKYHVWKFFNVNFCKHVYLVSLCSQDAQKTCLHFFGNLANFFFENWKKNTNSIIVTCLPFIILSLSQYLGPKLFLPV